MEYENPKIPENINVAPRNHLVDFIVLAIGSFVVIVLIVFIMGLSAGYLAKMIPFETELAISKPFENGINPAFPETEEYLSTLVNKITQCSELPQTMRIKYHYQDSEEVNAFATIGGNIVIFRGLIDKLDSENELAMIIAHEIAHVKNRHPIQSIGRSVMVSIIFSLLIDTSFTNPLDKAGLLTLLKFNRDMESESDKDALIALNRCYGHINGAVTVFEKFNKIQQEFQHNPIPFLSTHPPNKDRILHINKMAVTNQWKTSGELTTLPENIKN